MSSKTKNGTICVRLDDELAGAFTTMIEANRLGGPEAIRMGVRAMVEYYQQNGRIPRDMEIRQKVFDHAEPIKEAV